MAKARLLYVMDPMCSWCWGFAPVAEALSRQAAADGVAFHLVAGGLRAGHGAALDPNTRGYILGHWQTVQQTTGQPFRFDDALPEGFVYDTEPACRALVAARSLDEESAWPLVRAIQRAFYAEGRDVTQAAVLAGLAEAVGLPRIEFAAAFDSGEARRFRLGPGPRHRRVPDPAGRTQRPTGVAHQRLPAACRTFTLARPLAGTGPA